jgi:hypothetical protein
MRTTIALDDASWRRRGKILGSTKTQRSSAWLADIAARMNLAAA